MEFVAFLCDGVMFEPTEATTMPFAISYWIFNIRNWFRVQNLHLVLVLSVSCWDGEVCKGAWIPAAGIV